MNLDPFMHTGANITGMRLVELEDPKVTTVVDKWRRDLESSAFSLSPISPGQTQVPVSLTTKKSFLLHVVCLNALMPTGEYVTYIEMSLNLNIVTTILYFVETGYVSCRFVFVFGPLLCCLLR